MQERQSDENSSSASSTPEETDREEAVESDQSSKPAEEHPSSDHQPASEQAATGSDKGGQGGQAVPAGWYPDPHAPGSGRQRYWDGDQWTNQTQQGAALPVGATQLSTTRRSPDERKALLAQQIQMAAARGWRVESQSDYQAILVEGHPVNHTLHAILTIFTCLVWGIAWLIIAATGGETRHMITVDEFGKVQLQKLGKG
jgi:Protein of unknown function (DUF2510)